MSGSSSVAHDADAASFADPENPTYEECRRLGFRFLKPGKQCPHPVHTWFRDPRPSSSLPAPRSRRAILSQIYREHTSAPPIRVDAVLAHYIPREDPDPLTVTPQFALFPLLPPEIRQQIWELAIPSRTIDLRELRNHRQYTSIQYAAPLPVPHIARVCREARAVVFRLGCRLELLAAPSQAIADKNQIEKYDRYVVGFFMKGIDIPLHLPNMDTFDEQEYVLSVERPAHIPEEEGGSGQSLPVQKVELTTSALAMAMKCRAVALNFAGGTQANFAPGLLGRPPQHRHPVHSYGLGSAAVARGGLVKDWINIKNTIATPGNHLNTVYIYHKSRFIDVYLLVNKDFPSLYPPDQNEEGLEGPWYEVEIQLLVDLYDDERLSELASLETLNLDKGNDKPRYAVPAAANPGLCLNCKRLQWEKHVKPEVEALWLRLYEDELGEDGKLMEEVFDGSGTGLPYNKEHPWVQEKLKSAPEFRSAVLIHLRVAEEARWRRDAEEQEDWADLNSRIQAIR